MDVAVSGDPKSLAAGFLESSQQCQSIPQPAHSERSIGNQSQRDRAAKDTVALSLLPQLPGESINESYLPPASEQAFAR
jgi:hypothetical protein